jgi:hypothetical protein
LMIDWGLMGTKDRPLGLGVQPTIFQTQTSEKRADVE